MAANKTVSSMGMRIFFKILLMNGVSQQEIEQLTGIISSELGNPGYRVPMSNFVKLAETCYSITSDPSLSLHFSDYFDDSIQNYTSVLFANCDNLHEVCELISKYADLLSEANKFEFVESDAWLAISYSNISECQADWIPEFVFANGIQMFRRLLDDDINPMEVHLQRKAPSYINEYLKVFKSTVLFEQEKNTLFINNKYLNRPIPSANLILKTVLIEKADAMLDKQTKVLSFEEKVKEVIQHHISNRILNIEFAAEILGMHRTTLYRKLVQEGTTFAILLKEVRQEYALSFLQKDLSIQQISERLGYSDASAFKLAFKRWFGVSPGQYVSSSIE